MFIYLDVVILLSNPLIRIMIHALFRTEGKNEEARDEVGKRMMMMLIVRITCAE